MNYFNLFLAWWQPVLVGTAFAFFIYAFSYVWRLWRLAEQQISLGLATPIRANALAAGTSIPPLSPPPAFIADKEKEVFSLMGMRVEADQEKIVRLEAEMNRQRDKIQRIEGERDQSRVDCVRAEGRLQTTAAERDDYYNKFAVESQQARALNGSLETAIARAFFLESTVKNLTNQIASRRLYTLNATCSTNGNAIKIKYADHFSDSVLVSKISDLFSVAGWVTTTENIDDFALGQVAKRSQGDPRIAVVGADTVLRNDVTEQLEILLRDETSGGKLWGVKHGGYLPLQIDVLIFQKRSSDAW